MYRADELLRQAAATIEERGKQRDDAEGERSMRRAVGMFNAMVDGRPYPAEGFISELDGWLFMCCLKMARATAGKLCVDDYIDLAGYAALAAECAAYNVPIDELAWSDTPAGAWGNPTPEEVFGEPDCSCSNPLIAGGWCSGCGGEVREQWRAQTIVATVPRPVPLWKPHGAEL
jgi:hypothetical protein